MQGRPSQIISITGGAPTQEPQEPLPTLPQIATELEAYFTAARQMETALIQERANTRKAREEFHDFQLKASRQATEMENRFREYSIREDRLKSQFQSFQQNEKANLAQIQELGRVIENLKEEKKKHELDAELLRANLEHFKQREDSLKTTFQSLQAHEQARIDHLAQLTRDLDQARAEVGRFKASWAQVSAMDQKAKQLINEFHSAQRRVEELTQAREADKKRFEDLEQMLAKEKREKQVALSCVHTAESKLAQLTRDVEKAQRQKEHSGFDDVGLELKF